MPTWGETLKIYADEAASNGGNVNLDALRQKALQTLTSLTGRPTVVYASRWAQPAPPPELTSISIGDVHGFMEVLHGIRGPSLDLILHSSGGSPTATEAIVSYVRTKFDDVRVIVPLAAMSAACMLACSADRIVMGKHSYLGPIDPQILLQTSLGAQLVPAAAIIAQFEEAMRDASDPKRFPAWIPMLQQYGPALLITCQNAIKLSEDLVSRWLAKWMFRQTDGAETKAADIAKRLNQHDSHRTHSRYLPRSDVKALGLIIEDLEAEQPFQEAVLSVFHALTLSFTANSRAAKIIENHQGRMYVVHQGGAGGAPQGPKQANLPSAVNFGLENLPGGLR